MQLIFGIGALWGQRTDIQTVGPDQFAVLQNNEIDFSYEVKEMYSQLQFPIDLARGKGKITGKAKFARVFGQLYADLFFGVNLFVGSTTVAEYEGVTLGSVTYSTANNSTYIADLGVYYNATGNLKFTYVPSPPGVGGLGPIGTATPTLSAGQYSIINNTIYTFNMSDVGAAITVSYVYKNFVGGNTIPITNQFMGTTPTFSATFYQTRTTLGSKGQLTLLLNQCVSSRLTFPSRIDDYAIPDFDFQAFSTATNSIGTLSTTE